MSDAIKHECGISVIRLLKPLSYYKEKYGTAFYGVNKMYLMMEKQHNRGQDGAGFASIKLDMKPGERYMSRVRSIQQQPIQDIFDQINDRINTEFTKHPEYKEDVAAQKNNIPYIGEVLLGHVRYGTFGKNSIESVHPFLRQNNWMHRNLIVAGNFNMTNVNELFDNLVQLGQHPKEMADTVTVMEKIGHFLDDAVAKLYKQIKKEGYSKMEASPLIAERLKLNKILRKAAKNWDGGYAMAGMLGHGDAFVLRDPSGIRPAYYYKDDEIVAVASERPAIQTVFNVPFEKVKEISPGHAIIIKKDGSSSINKILEPRERKACSFERIYFSRGSDKEIYQERKELGKLLFPQILKAINNDIKHTVFSYIPNTAETSFFGMVKEAQNYLNKKKEEQILSIGSKITQKELHAILDIRPRIEKVAIKDAKLRTFITQDSSRDDLVAHVYDISYGSVKKNDNLVIIDDSIVRGTTLKKSILRILDRLSPKKIIVVSSAPQIRYPDCYGIDMAKLEDFVAFKAALALHQDNNTMDQVEAIYKKCIDQAKAHDDEIVNYVKDFYAPFTANQISDKIGELLSPPEIKAQVKIIYQTIESLHQACPDNLGDWYFTGNYPTKGGNRVVNKAFINFYEGKNERAY
ncbi:amidophosphoribosyltransferase [Maribacter sp. TH_r10]|uniref:Amidophosphoribosyltransferase n=1 Tax=Maribacter luteus TaxID=2594478 RepID=A0A6I2MKM4_9FLAO|nr:MULTISPECIES: amidophosphoribosyltransferase [Maribacter]MDV7137773.1 amidophosphoribosyltransferase [Maribacter sp. TH_r10]MRX63065.1 amidophosphoribosyltransferase [Maribacter luteus]|tara:strand:- start:5666 stop:7564 length:1899 start_codon:yes stop_codon:yes gene_type:complete